MSEGAVIPRVAALDGLRGAAVAGVLLFHGGHLVGGYLGVDLFFVLSGFLITSLLLAEADREASVGLGGFWARRARRLLPAVAGLMFGVGLYCLFFAKPTELAGIRFDGLATLFYVANWREVLARHDYWALFDAPSPLQHTWSLAIEEQFYLVWPLVFVGLLTWWKRATPKAVLVVCVVGAVVSTSLMAVLYDGVNVSRVYYGTDTRVSAILLGGALAAALAIWGPVKSRASRMALEIAGVAGALVLGVAWTRVSGQAPSLYRGGLFVCGLAVVAVIAAAAHPEAGLISRVFSWRPLCVLGLISYGVYLWHWPVYVVLDPVRTGISGWPLLSLRIVVTLVIATASYVILEQPIRHGALSARSWRWLAPALAMGLVLVVLGSTIGAKPAVTAAAAKPDSVDEAVSAASHAPADARRIMVVGNSVGFFIGRGMQELHYKPPLVTLDRAKIACVFPSGASLVRYSSDEQGRTAGLFTCDETWKTDVEKFRPDTVILIAYCCAGEYLYGGRWMDACDSRYASMYRLKLREAIRTLGSTGAHVVVTTTPYASLEFLFPARLRTIACTNRLRRTLAPKFGASVVDLFNWTCPQPPQCRARADGVILRTDGVHFRDEAARIVARWLLDQVYRRSPAP